MSPATSPDAGVAEAMHHVDPHKISPTHPHTHTHEDKRRDINTSHTSARTWFCALLDSPLHFGGPLLPQKRQTTFREPAGCQLWGLWGVKTLGRVAQRVAEEEPYFWRWGPCQSRRSWLGLGRTWMPPARRCLRKLSLRGTQPVRPTEDSDPPRRLPKVAQVAALFARIGDLTSARCAAHASTGRRVLAPCGGLNLWSTLLGRPKGLTDLLRRE